MDEALTIAPGLHLRAAGQGGTGDGVIGALAGLGLPLMGHERLMPVPEIKTVLRNRQSMVLVRPADP